MSSHLPHHSSVTRKSAVPPLSPVLAIHSTVHLLKLGSPPPHKEARQRRKELRRKLLAEQEELERQMKELQVANENKQQELESVRKVSVGGKPPSLGAAEATSRRSEFASPTPYMLGQEFRERFGDLSSQEVCPASGSTKALSHPSCPLFVLSNWC